PSASGARDRKSYEYAWKAQFNALKQVYQNFRARTEELKHLWLASVLWTKQQSEWLHRDSLFDALTTEHGTDDWLKWSTLDQNLWIDLLQPGSHPDAATRSDKLHKKFRGAIEFYNFCQFLVHKQHEEYRKFAGGLGISLYADMQIGFSQRDMWSLRNIFLAGY